MISYYSPHTFEHIQTDNPADWMGRAGTPAPEYDSKTHGCFWRGDRWEVVSGGPPAPPVFVCSPWQIRKALNAQGLRQQVEDAVATSDDIALKDGWEFATQFNSDDPFVLLMGESIGKSPDEVRDLIQYAATL